MQGTWVQSLIWELDGMPQGMAKKKKNFFSKENVNLGDMKDLMVRKHISPSPTGPTCLFSSMMVKGTDS